MTEERWMSREADRVPERALGRRTAGAPVLARGAKRDRARYQAHADKMREQRSRSSRSPARGEITQSAAADHRGGPIAFGADPDGATRLSTANSETLDHTARSSRRARAGSRQWSTAREHPAQAEQGTTAAEPQAVAPRSERSIEGRPDGVDNSTNPLPGGLVLAVRIESRRPNPLPKG